MSFQQQVQSAMWAGPDQQGAGAQAKTSRGANSNGAPSTPGPGTGANVSPQLPRSSSARSLNSMHREPSTGALPQMFNTREPSCKLQVNRVNWHTHWWVYFKDPFHTLLNMPAMRFYVCFFLIFLLSYAAFALIYLVNSDQCIEGIQHFGHAFYFSVQTAATIGYGGTLIPNPDCVLINLCVTLQTIASLMVDYTMLGLVYARFSAATGRASSICFSINMTMHQHLGDLMLSFRVASVRKKEILKPEVTVLIALEDESDCAGVNEAEAGRILRLQNVAVHLSKEAQASLWLGLPATVSHIIDSSSPLAHISLEQMAERGMQILVMVDGVDKMTSNSVQARHCYTAYDIVYDNFFQEDLIRRRPSGRLTVDFRCFEGPEHGLALHPPLESHQQVTPYMVTPPEDVAAPAAASPPAAADDSLNEPLLPAAEEQSGPRQAPAPAPPRRPNLQRHSAPGVMGLQSVAVSIPVTHPVSSVFAPSQPPAPRLDDSFRSQGRSLTSLPFKKFASVLATEPRRDRLDAVDEGQTQDLDHALLKADLMEFLDDVAPLLLGEPTVQMRVSNLQSRLAQADL